MSGRSFAVRTAGVPPALEQLCSPSLAAGSAGHEKRLSLTPPLSLSSKQFRVCGLAGRDETSLIQEGNQSTPVAVAVPWSSSPAHRASAQLHNTLRDALACVVRVLSKKRSVHARSLSLFCCCCVLAAQCIWVRVLLPWFLLLFLFCCEVRVLVFVYFMLFARDRELRSPAFAKRAPSHATRHAHFRGPYNTPKNECSNKTTTPLARRRTRNARKTPQVFPRKN
jgi:hypothetical protein